VGEGEAKMWQARPLKECRVLIAGGTSGVGLATAIRFAEAGAQAIGVVGRNRERGEAALRMLEAQTPRAQVRFFAGDCNRPDGATAVC